MPAVPGGKAVPDLVAYRPKDLQHFVRGAGSPGGIFKPDMLPIPYLAGKERAGLVGFVADGDEMIEGGPEIVFDPLRKMCADIDAHLGHHLNRPRMDALGRYGARRNHLQIGIEGS